MWFSVIRTTLEPSVASYVQVAVGHFWKSARSKHSRRLAANRPVCPAICIRFVIYGGVKGHQGMYKGEKRIIERLYNRNCVGVYRVLKL